ncbi:peptidase inhibitor family I36 protein [Streptomyces griseocarneus]|uniref:peptidase inhibitor family I36 protein n=1 Tax=Streptomyces griseocarneus TaxID=51201 RepID=UPI00167C84CD|nr:peptidase inhibitor family I36 protein [Streptomyces griseocarneus]MBZ6475690.1 peptidase inhibitor family I36 protein [Streptomyces griseocarneus]GHG68856.1 hypothetical protein GCM10018779_41680 [Streptomyces griseocarneus]
MRRHWAPAVVASAAVALLGMTTSAPPAHAGTFDCPRDRICFWQSKDQTGAHMDYKAPPKNRCVKVMPRTARSGANGTRADIHLFSNSVCDVSGYVDDLYAKWSKIKFDAEVRSFYRY